MINNILRPTAYVTLVSLFLLAVLPTGVSAGQVKCDYDKKLPSIEHARGILKALNYICAEQELVDLLEMDTTSLSLESRASAHILLGTVYFLMARQIDEERGRVLNEFVEALRIYREWSGSLELELPELREILNDARNQVEREIQAKLDHEIALSDSLSIGEKKRNKKKVWWFVAGTAVLSTVAFIAFGGKRDSDDSDDTGGIPDYPPPPQ